MANPALNRTVGFYKAHRTSAAGKVTMDSVVQKTSITLGLLVLAAAIAWYGLSQAYNGGNAQQLSLITGGAIAATLAATGLSFVIAFKRSISIPLIIIFALLEGVAIGVMSKAITLHTGSADPVVGAVLGTFITVGATLAVYKFTNWRTTPKMRRFLNIAILAFVGISLVDFGLSLFGSSMGVNGFGTVGVIFSVIGLVIALFMLYSDFEAVEDAITYGAPEVESWRLAYGLTVTLVWIYVNLLRILVALRNN